MPLSGPASPTSAARTRTSSATRPTTTERVPNVFHNLKPPAGRQDTLRDALDRTYDTALRYFIVNPT